MISPSLEKAKTLAKDNAVVPIAMEIFSDTNTSIGILQNMRQKQANCFLLESVASGQAWGRYSFLGCKPALLLRGANGLVTMQKNQKRTSFGNDAKKAINSVLSQYKSPIMDDLPPFTGGLVGYFAYEFAQYFLPSLNLEAENTQEFDDFCLMLIDKVIAVDHFRQKIVLIANISTNNLEESYASGVKTLYEMKEMVLKYSPILDEKTDKCGKFTPLHTKEQFCKKVENIKHHICRGDIFQAVLSNRFSAKFSGSLFQTYRVLRTTNPSPYMVYMHINGTEIACSSPETLVSLKNGKLQTFPLAGTCPRGKTPKEDKTLTDALLLDEKELAEHDMLVDLGRNDLGKVSTFGTVQLEEYRSIKKFAHVSHIASQICAQLAPQFTAVDALCATLPAGTLSGAPKKRAMEIIDAAEGVRRGIYGGALGYLDFAGNMDFCIGIRMAVHKNGQVLVQSGAGIVADSLPQKEYRESQNKARAIIDALKTACRQEEDA